MNTLNWESEQARFMAVAYEPALGRYRLRRWHPSKREDAESEFMAKMW